MILWKLTGAVLVVLAATAAGWQKAAHARKRVQSLHSLEQLMARIQGEIGYRGTALADLLVQLKEEGFCPELGLDDCTELRFYTLPSVLTVSERQRLAGFFTQLGQATSEESVSQGLYYQKQCAELLEKAQIEACTAEGLYTKLGLCCGSLLALLLL